jgi:hypothetical protein
VRKARWYDEYLTAFGLFIADVGHWVAGYEWGVDIYAHGLRDGLDHPVDAFDYLSDRGEGT